MDVLRQWAICITISSLISAVVYALSPKGNMQKAMQVIISIFFLCALLSPFLSESVINIDFETNNYLPQQENKSDELNERINEQMLEISKRMVEEQVQSIFYSYQIYNGQICTIMDIDSNGSIFIKSMTLYLQTKDMDKKTQVTSSVCSRFNIEEKTITVSRIQNDEG
ncbi:MAG: stage III sporulation protein AF [Acutalibacteraceae bacterium]|jgi:hypothetical protein|nr:hypothetical protein [Clostridiales bacterium]